MQSYLFDPDLKSSLRRNLAGLDLAQDTRPELRSAAVAIVVTQQPDSDQAGVLMTFRPPKMNRHGGQYALPGGRLDAGETREQAALRELQEELGLDLGPDDIIGRLDDYPTRSGFCVSPIVMWARGTVTLRPDPAEVEQVFHLPLTELDSPDIPRLQDSQNGTHPVLSAFFPTLGHHMYAPTAAILYQFREVALRGQATRVAHFDEPVFAWK